jgi:hypothetical protein
MARKGHTPSWWIERGVPNPSPVTVIDLTWQSFGRLIVVERGPNSKAGSTRWRCRCECGGEALVEGTDLRRGHTTSCGCRKREEAFLPRGVG